MEYDHSARYKAEHNAYVLDVPQGSKVDRLEVVSLLASFQKLLKLALTDVVVVLVAHRVMANVERQTDSLSRILHVASALDDVFGSDIEGSWTIFLLEVTAEVALMVILPFDNAANLIHKFCRRNALPRLVHSSLIGAFERGVTVVVEKTTTGVAGLGSTF